MLVSIPSRSIFDSSDPSTAQRQQAATGRRREVWPILVATAVCVFANLLPLNGLLGIQIDVYSQVTLILVNRIWHSPKLFKTLFASMVCLLCTYILVAAKSYLVEALWPLSLTVDILVSF